MVTAYANASYVGACKKTDYHYTDSDEKIQMAPSDSNSKHGEGVVHNTDGDKN